MMSIMCAETEAQPALMGAVLKRRFDELAQRAAPLIRMTNRGLPTTLLRRGCSGRTRTRGMLAAHTPRMTDAG
jgi:hypothetical protein